MIDWDEVEYGEWRELQRAIDAEKAIRKAHRSKEAVGVAVDRSAGDTRRTMDTYETLGERLIRLTSESKLEWEPLDERWWRAQLPEDVVLTLNTVQPRLLCRRPSGAAVGVECPRVAQLAALLVRHDLGFVLEALDELERRSPGRSDKS